MTKQRYVLYIYKGVEPGGHTKDHQTEIALQKPSKTNFYDGKDIFGR